MRAPGPGARMHGSTGAASIADRTGHAMEKASHASEAGGGQLGRFARRSGRPAGGARIPCYVIDDGSYAVLVGRVARWRFTGQDEEEAACGCRIWVLFVLCCANKQ